ncbi:rhodanese-like domain-containing protein [Caulobacter sp. S45]|jgi:phage shock protein E|uniref:rhodanese-like domain-containing protein n=1 Tax=Caulobacter sp. S45 TaxID=1641861 RepID=UPI00131E60EF|nr:rhodanese-like domain-containing protein [Caulobacter sp. S45]
MPAYDYTDIRRLAADARTRITELTPDDARLEIARGALLIDVRDDVELLQNPPLASAIHLSRGQLEYTISEVLSDKDTPLVLYCAGGNRGALATESLQKLGYTRVFNLEGGLRAWRLEAGQRWLYTDRKALVG